jgi:hypothetical protein
VCEAHAEGDTVDRAVSIFADSFHAALDARSHGGVPPHETVAEHQSTAE